MENEWGEPIVTDTELDADELANSTEDDSQGQTESEATTQSAPTDDLDSRVNSLVEQRMEQERQTRAAEVQRLVQSELQKRRNQADKQLAEDKRAIERMTQRGQIDAKRAQELQAEAQAEADKAKRVWDVDDEPTYQPPAQTDAPRIVSRTEISQYLQSEGLSPTDIETISGKYAGLPSNAPNAQAALMEDIQAAKARRAPSAEQRAVQQFGSTASPAGRTGNAAGDPEKELEQLGRQDPSTYPGGVMAYERRQDALEAALIKSGKWKS